MIRLIDFLLSFFGILLLSPIMLILYVLGFFDTGSPLFFQIRVGKHKRLFHLVKFRSMRKETQSVSTHLVDSAMLTKFGKFIRKTKLDELPQLFNVFLGHMSLVGPRPNLLSQREVIYERRQRGVYHLKPGITGLAQIQGIDMSTPILLSETDAQMMSNFSLKKYFYYIFGTISGKGRGDRTLGNTDDN